MTWRSIWREAWRNVLSGAARPKLLAVLAMLVVLAAQLADLSAVWVGQNRAEQYRAAGADVLVLQAQGGIDPARCNALSDVPGVDAAGAIRAAAPQHAASAPGSSIPSFEVTSGFAAVLAPQAEGDAAPSGAGAILSSEAAAMLSARPGDQLRFIEGATTVAAVYAYPADGRMQGLGYALLMPTTELGAYDACWMRAWPADDAHQVLLQTVASGASETPPELRQLNPRLGAVLDAASIFEERPTRWLPLAAAGVLAAIGAGAVLLRRLELASARHLGVSGEAVTAITVLETALWLIPAMLVSLVTGAAAAAALGPEDVAAGLGLALLAPVAGAVGAFLGSGITARLIDERHVYRAFRQR